MVRQIALLAYQLAKVIPQWPNSVGSAACTLTIDQSSYLWANGNFSLAMQLKIKYNMCRSSIRQFLQIKSVCLLGVPIGLLQQQLYKVTKKNP